jgi:hypothetical protein
MKKLLAITVVMLFVASLSLGITGCKNSEDAADKVKEAANKATTKVYDVTKETVSKVKETANDAVNNVFDASKETVAKVNANTKEDVNKIKEAAGKDQEDVKESTE